MLQSARATGPLMMMMSQNMFVQEQREHQELQKK